MDFLHEISIEEMNVLLQSKHEKYEMYETMRAIVSDTCTIYILRCSSTFSAITVRDALRFLFAKSFCVK